MVSKLARSKHLWIVSGICIYIAVCVLGFLYLLTDSPNGAGNMSAGHFLFLLLIVSPLGLIAYAFGERLLEIAFNAAARGIRAWRRK